MWRQYYVVTVMVIMSYTVMSLYDSVTACSCHHMLMSACKPVDVTTLCFRTVSAGERRGSGAADQGSAACIRHQQPSAPLPCQLRHVHQRAQGVQVCSCSPICSTMSSNSADALWSASLHSKNKVVFCVMVAQRTHKWPLAQHKTDGS